LTKHRQFTFSIDEADPLARDLDEESPLDAHEPVGLTDDPLDVDLDAWLDEPATHEAVPLDGVDHDDDETDAPSPVRDDDARGGGPIEFEELPDFADRSDAVDDEAGPLEPSTAVEELDPLGHDDTKEGLDDAHDGVDAAALPPLDEAEERDEDTMAVELPPDPRVDGRWARLSVSESARAWVDHASAEGSGARISPRAPTSFAGGRLRLRRDDRGCAVVLVERDDGALVPLDGPLQGLAIESSAASVLGGADALAVLDGHHLTVARRDRGRWARERCTQVVAAALMGEDHDADVLLVRRDARGLTLARLGSGGLVVPLAELDGPHDTERIELDWSRAMEIAFVRLNDVVLAFRRTLDH
jgi:hypothetical protein